MRLKQSWRHDPWFKVEKVGKLREMGFSSKNISRTLKMHENEVKYLMGKWPARKKWLQARGYL